MNKEVAVLKRVKNDLETIKAETYWDYLNVGEDDE